MTSLIKSGFKDPIYFVTLNNGVSISDKNVVVLNGLSENEMIHYIAISKVAVVPSSMLSIETIALRKPIFTMFYVNNQELIYKGNVELQLAAGCGFIESGDDMENIIKPFLDL